jgi:uncharacterized protein (DUF433 family)
MGIGSMIEFTPGVCGGRARLAGTRVAVHRVAGYYRLGYSAEGILGLLPSLTLSQIYAGLAHALASARETDEALAEEAQAFPQLKPQNQAARHFPGSIDRQLLKP